MQYIRDLSAGQKTSVVGHSIGGYLALQMASEQPEKFEKLFIVDALPFLPAAQNPAVTEEQLRAYPVEAMVQQYEQMDSLTFRQMQQQVVSSMVGNEEYHAAVLGWSMTSDRRTMAYTVNEMMCTDLRQEIAEIDCPVMVLGAWAENYPQSREATQNIYEEQYQSVSQVEVRFPASARHFIMLDAPEWYAEQLSSFFIQSLDHE
jgi:pimeloyl-ACP methyl ester carboxylesterase